jgi:hypothetical protein
VVGQEPARNDGVVELTLHALAPPAGSLDVNTVPELSETKHWGWAEQNKPSSG